MSLSATVLTSLSQASTAPETSCNDHKQYCLKVFWSVIALICVLSVTYPVIVMTFFKMPISMAWVQKAFQIKTEAAQKIKEPKIIFAGGSNVHFGINTEMVSKALGKPAINFGVMGLLGLDYILYRTKEIAKSGDSIVLPLEYFLYDFNARESWVVQRTYYLFTYDQGFLTQHLPWFWQAYAFWKVTPLDLLTSVLYEQVRAKLNLSMLGYSLDTISPLGNELGENPKKPNLQLASPVSTNLAAFPSSEATALLKDFKTWCLQKNIRLYLTFPNTADLPEHHTKVYQEAFIKLLEALKLLGIPIIGKPQDAMVPSDVMFDSQYHLSKKGISLRTQKLIPLLKEAGV